MNGFGPSALFLRFEAVGTSEGLPKFKALGFLSGGGWRAPRPVAVDGTRSVDSRLVTEPEDVCQRKDGPARSRVKHFLNQS